MLDDGGHSEKISRWKLRNAPRRCISEAARIFAYAGMIISFHLCAGSRSVRGRRRLA
ncbi:hypothetical protein PUN28_018035 [Cardiocondyla obscurior]|uniref:Uncharacterized protein n=1 Tax=Cardiocondyla obscurior TaxID=286306 RepID=A0AAW2EFJ6_9HYME